MPPNAIYIIHLSTLRTALVCATFVRSLTQHLPLKAFTVRNLRSITRSCQLPREMNPWWGSHKSQESLSLSSWSRRARALAMQYNTSISSMSSEDGTTPDGTTLTHFSTSNLHVRSCKALKELEGEGWQKNVRDGKFNDHIEAQTRAV